MNIKSTLKAIKLNESTISMVLGAIVIVVVGALLVNYFSAKKGETTPPLEIGDEVTLPTTHTVTEGEDLWSISETYYDTGYNWVDIAQENEIVNPNQIEEEQQLIIPDVQPRIAQSEATPSPTTKAAARATTQPSPTMVMETVSRDGETVHIVSEGQHLWNIAERYYDSGYNWVDIAKANNLNNPGLIDEGQELLIPDAEPKTATVTAPEVAGTKKQTIEGDTYEVQKSDSLWKIAVRAYGDGYRWSDIAEANDLENPGLIHPGNVLTLPR